MKPSVKLFDNMRYEGSDTALMNLSHTDDGNESDEKENFQARVGV